MNLLTDPWLTVCDVHGDVHRISLSAVSDPRYIDLIAVRPDFRGAVPQWVIGVLTGTLAPYDLDEWRELDRHPPSAEELTRAFAPWVAAFELEADGPAFMQDLTLPADANRWSVQNLLIDAGSGSNLHFNKPVSDPGFCAACTAQALFTLQINAPLGGSGTRVSLRGGGPMTTLLVPQEAQATLWQRLWLNVLSTEAMSYPPVTDLAQVLPWMGPTRTSDGPDGLLTTPETVHPLQAYWSMPRRIRLEPAVADAGACSLCEVEGEPLYRYYRARHGGTNYGGSWLHPLTPYHLDPKHEKPPTSVKGRFGGVGYRNWLGLALGSNDGKPQAAKVVSHYQAHIKKPPVRLWCFGYDMDNMKACCWYDSTLPVHVVEDGFYNVFIREVKLMIDVAEEAASTLHGSVKAAWFRRPKDVKNSEPAIFQSFWQGSERAFYTRLEQLAALDLEDEAALATLQHGWLREVQGIAMSLFEHWVLAGPVEGQDLQRVVEARTGLIQKLHAGKHAKAVGKTVKAQAKEKT